MDSRATKQEIWKFIIDKCSKVLILKKLEINYKLSKFKVKLRKLTEPFLGFLDTFVEVMVIELWPDTDSVGLIIEPLRPPVAQLHRAAGPGRSLSFSLSLSLSLSMSCSHKLKQIYIQQSKNPPTGRCWLYWVTYKLPVHWPLHCTDRRFEYLAFLVSSITSILSLHW